MPVDLQGLRVFIASPGGLDRQRGFIVEAIHDFNNVFAEPQQSVFIPVCWENLPGGVGRAQELINKRLRTCDYMILILHDRWGSPTGKYDSGVQEEFHVAVECLSDAAQPMKDILILFKAIDDARLRDPGKELEAVLDFRRRLEASTGFFYRQFDDDSSLKREVDAAFAEWLRRDQAPRSTSVTLADSDAVEEPPPDVDTVLLRARELETDGRITQAEAHYAIAVADARPDALREYAKFLRRRGRLERSFEINESLLALPGEATPDRARSNAEALANMGLVRRKQGRFEDARELLLEAVAEGRSAGHGGRDVLAYALDNLGLVLRRLGATDTAANHHREAEKLHAQSGNQAGVAQSLRHLSALEIARGDLDSARVLMEGARAAAHNAGDDRTLAAVHAQFGHVLELSGQIDEARQEYTNALEVNERIASPDGEAMAHVQLGRLELDAGNLPSASYHARRALERFRHSGNSEGVATATQLLGRHELGGGRPDAARSLFIEAIEQAVGIGNASSEGWSRKYLAEALDALGLPDERDVQLELAAAIAERTGARTLRDVLG